MNLTIEMVASRYGHRCEDGVVIIGTDGLHAVMGYSSQLPYHKMYDVDSWLLWNGTNASRMYGIAGTVFHDQVKTAPYCVTLEATIICIEGI